MSEDLNGPCILSAVLHHGRRWEAFRTEYRRNCSEWSRRWRSL